MLCLSELTCAETVKLQLGNDVRMTYVKTMSLRYYATVDSSIVEFKPA